MKRRRLLLALAVVAAGLSIWIFLLRPTGTEAGIVAAGTVEARESDLGFRAAGRIDSIFVDEGDRVRQDDLLATLDRRELLATLAVARGRAAAARATLGELTEGFRSEEIEEARALLRGAERRLSDATRDLSRARNLFSDGAISQQALDDRETAVTLAEAEVKRIGERLRLLETGTRVERIAAQRAVLDAAEAEVERAEAVLEYASVVAPYNGLVTIRHREPGEIVPTGAPVLTLMDPEDRWVRIYVRADKVGRLSLGQAASVTADAYPDRVYTGRVMFIASEAEFTPRDVQTTEERVKLVYQVKIRIAEDPSFDLKPGLAADVRLAPDGG